VGEEAEGLVPALKFVNIKVKNSRTKLKKESNIHGM
jgi:hypothetical protein